MRPSSDDVHHLMDERLARFHPKRGKRSRGLRQLESRLQYNGIHPSSSGEIDIRISSSCLVSQEIHRNPVSLRIYNKMLLESRSLTSVHTSLPLKSVQGQEHGTDWVGRPELYLHVSFVFQLCPPRWMVGRLLSPPQRPLSTRQPPRFLGSGRPARGTGIPTGHSHTLPSPITITQLNDPSVVSTCLE
ncbi:unnamed protein product [Protopolystoma xenopodis]|uniref:Uncharacterized protein n=1 Tax=Protopolystoma xenopodis TaxID=117903 RepID=A0A3S5CMS7_9PLAT|nr:unnamed protein product [Protopolystoma xenopodis]